MQKPAGKFTNPFLRRLFERLFRESCPKRTPEPLIWEEALTQ